MACIQAYIDKHGTRIVHLEELLTDDEIEQLGADYDPDEHSIDLTDLNLLRIEIQYKRSRILRRVNDMLTGESKSKRLLTRTLTNELEAEILYNSLNEVFNCDLKEHVFIYEPDTVSEVKGSAKRRAVVEMLADDDDLDEWKMIFKDKGKSESFARIEREVKKKVAQSPLYSELYHKLLGKTKAKPVTLLTQQQEDTPDVNNGTEDDTVSHVSKARELCGVLIRTYSYDRPLKRYNFPVGYPGRVL